MTIDIEATRAAVTIARDKCIEALTLLDAEPEPIPEPPLPGPTTTSYGACPGTPDFSAQEVIDKFGPCDLRLFDGGKGTSFICPRPSAAALIHCSWKLFGKSDAPTSPSAWDSFVRKVTVNMRAGDIIEVEHEHDVKYRKAVKANDPNAQRDLDTRMKLKADLHDAVMRVRPDLRTCSTVAVWTFDAGQLYQYEKFMARATMLGIDFDGMSGQPNYLKWLDACVNGADEHYEGRWSVPEYGYEPGSNRLTEMQRQTPEIAERNPVSIMYWDDDNGTYDMVLDTNAEIDYWSGLCAQD